MPREEPREYVKVSSVSEALDALGQYGPSATLLAGGTDLLVQIRQDATRPLFLIDLEGISSLRGIAEKDGYLIIGALATLREVEKAKAVCSRVPALVESARGVGALQLRNRATIGGNLCQSPKCPYYNQSHINAFMRESIRPCIRRGGKTCHTAKWGSEMNHALMAGKNSCKAPVGSNIATALATLGGSVTLANQSGSREVKIENFYDENGQPTLGSNEIITQIKLPGKTQGKSLFLQHKPNPASYMLLNVGVSLQLEDGRETCRNARVWFGGVAPGPYEAKEVEECLKGKRLSKQIIEQASQLLLEHISAREATMTFKMAKAKALCSEALLRTSGR